MHDDDKELGASSLFDVAIDEKKEVAIHEICAITRLSKSDVETLAAIRGVEALQRQVHIYVQARDRGDEIRTVFGWMKAAVEEGFLPSINEPSSRARRRGEYASDLPDGVRDYTSTSAGNYPADLSNLRVEGGKELSP